MAVRGLMLQARLTDRSLAWLRNRYIKLFFEDGCCCEPLAADAVRVSYLFLICR